MQLYVKHSKSYTHTNHRNDRTHGNRPNQYHVGLFDEGLKVEHGKVITFNHINPFISVAFHRTVDLHPHRLRTSEIQTLKEITPQTTQGETVGLKANYPACQRGKWKISASATFPDTLRSRKGQTGPAPCGNSF